jgi:hypothetical protein
VGIPAAQFCAENAQNCAAGISSSKNKALKKQGFIEGRGGEGGIRTLGRGIPYA